MDLDAFKPKRLVAFAGPVFSEEKTVNNNYVRVVGWTTLGTKTNYIRGPGDLYFSIVTTNISNWSLVDQ